MSQIDRDSNSVSSGLSLVEFSGHLDKFYISYIGSDPVVHLLD